MTSNQTSTVLDHRRVPLTFTGRAGEYFGIWTVNVLLTIVTIGIWSAWAKVRNKRYFLGSTQLAGSAFEYHATGWQILKGRLLLVAVLVAINLSSFIDEAIPGLLVLAIAPLMPWAINQSLRFNMRNTSWRNVRFGFRGHYWGAFRIFLLMPIAVVFTLGALAPVASRMTARYVAANTRYGTAGFASDFPISRLYGWVFAIYLSVLAIGVTIALIATTTGLMTMVVEAVNDPAMLLAILSQLALLLVALYLVILIGPGFVALAYRASLSNLSISGLTLTGGHQFRCALSPLGWATRVISAGILILLTLGLMTPWAKVWLYRYRVGAISVFAGSDLDGFVAAEAAAVGSAGTAMSDYLDLDASL